MAALLQQFVRFAGIGFLNTAVDYAVFNFIAVVTGVYTGAEVGYISAASFGVAVLHSYFWNKHWAFAAVTRNREPGLLRNMGQFVVAAIVGAVLVAAILFGSSQKFAYFYYLLVLVVLVGAEVALWKIFRLKKSDSADGQTAREFVLFIIISLIGIVINYFILNLGTTNIPPQFGLNQELWTNLIKVAATGVALVWNFIGYKIFVFKR